MKRTVGIFARDIGIASRFLDKIIGETLYKNVSKVTKTSYKYEAELADGTIYKTVLANQSSKGTRLTDAYVHKDVEPEYVNSVIMPSIIDYDKLESRITFFE